MAVVVPVLVVDLVGTDSVKSARGLEPTKLSAVLICPTSTRIVDIDGSGHDLRVGSIVVTNWRVACCNLNTNQCEENLLISETLKSMDLIAEALGTTILNGASWKIANVSHKIRCGHTLGIGILDNLINRVRLSLISQHTLTSRVDTEAL